jgi:hypothetical protein
MQKIHILIIISILISLCLICFGLNNIRLSKNTNDINKCNQRLRKNGIIMIILGCIPLICCLLCYIYNILYKKLPINEVIKNKVSSLLDDVDISPQKLLETISIFQRSPISPVIINKNSISPITPSLTSTIIS